MTTPHRALTRPTIFIECTATFRSDRVTGIERAVHNILRHAPASAGRRGFDVVPVMLDDGELVRIAASALAGSRARPIADQADNRWQQRLQRQGRWYRLAVKQRLARVLGGILPADTLRRLLYGPSQGWSAHVRRIKTLLGWPTRNATRALSGYHETSQGVLLLPDSSWDHPCWPDVRRFRAGGGKVVTLLYDLAPIRHPETCTEEMAAKFGVWLIEQLTTSDAFIAISAAVADDLRRFIASQTVRRPRDIPIGHFHLGADLDQSAIDAARARPDVEAIFRAPRHCFAMVGSIVPRKNHAFALDAFDMYWAAGGTGALVLVGHQTWQMEAFMVRLRDHERLGETLHHLSDAEDGELEFVYRNASALVMASKDEGFGLPVVEALQRGLPVICSEIPVFREIANNSATFFDLLSPRALSEILLKFEARYPPGTPAPREPRPWLTWEQSIEAMVHECFRLLNIPAGSL